MQKPRKLHTTDGFFGGSNCPATHAQTPKPTQTPDSAAASTPLRIPVTSVATSVEILTITITPAAPQQPPANSQTEQPPEQASAAPERPTEQADDLAPLAPPEPIHLTSEHVIEEPNPAPAPEVTTKAKNPKQAKPTKRRKPAPQHLIMFIAGVIVVACLVLLALWLVDGWRSQSEYQGVTDTATSITGDGDAATDQTINFDELKNTNPDTVAWVRIPGTAINYPVVQTTDNATYLTRTFTGGYSLSGTIFLDAGNAADLTSTNSILYGHHRVDGTMFADLDLIYDGTLGDAPQIYLYLPDGTVNTYTVFSTYVTENDPVSINPNVTSFADFARDMQARSERQFATDPLSITVADSANTGRNQQILTLSTCVANDDRRYLVHAVLTAVDQF